MQQTQKPKRLIISKCSSWLLRQRTELTGTSCRLVIKQLAQTERWERGEFAYDGRKNIYSPRKFLPQRSQYEVGPTHAVSSRSWTLSIWWRAGRRGRHDDELRASVATQCRERNVVPLGISPSLLGKKDFLNSSADKVLSKDGSDYDCQSRDTQGLD